MAFTVYQAGTKLYGMDQRGSVVQLTLPTGVTLDANLRLRAAVYGNYAILVNSPSRPLTVDANLNVRVLCPLPPISAPTAAASSGAGSLTGAYKTKQTYRVRDAFGRLIAESDYGPESNSVSLTSKKLNVSKLNLSADVVSASGLYRTTAGTETFFPWSELEGNTQTTFEDGKTDADLDAVAAPTLGTPPDLKLIAEFRGRLFGVAKAALDSIRYSEAGFMYAWPSANVEQVPRIGSDNRGVTGFIRRRESLAIGRANGLYEWTGTSSSNFRIINISENCGIESPDSVQVYRDTGFFVWRDGVYQWGANGVANVSDEKVSRWFSSNSTFNLGRLQYAIGQIDPYRKVYRVYLASAGSASENCWIEYDFRSGKFWGPHLSRAFDPSAAFWGYTDSGLTIPLVGGRDGYVRRERKRRTDDTSTPIPFEVVLSRDNAGSEDAKFFGALQVSGQTQPSGKVAVITTVGSADERRDKGSALTIASEYDMTMGSETLDRIGEGEAFKVLLAHNTAGETVNLRSVQVDDVFVVGRR